MAAPVINSDFIGTRPGNKGIGNAAVQGPRDMNANGADKITDKSPFAGILKAVLSNSPNDGGSVNPGTSSDVSGESAGPDAGADAVDAAVLAQLIMQIYISMQVQTQQALSGNPSDSMINGEGEAAGGSPVGPDITTLSMLIRDLRNLMAANADGKLPLAGIGQLNIQTLAKAIVDGQQDGIAIPDFTALLNAADNVVRGDLSNNQPSASKTGEDLSGEFVKLSVLGNAADVSTNKDGKALFKDVTSVTVSNGDNKSAAVPVQDGKPVVVPVQDGKPVAVPVQDGKPVVRNETDMPGDDTMKVQQKDEPPVGTFSTAGPVNRGMNSGDGNAIKPVVTVSRPAELDQPILKAIGNGEKYLIIKLDPPDLGSVRIKLTMVDGNIRADLKVDSGVVKDLFNSSIPHIKASLESAGVKVSDIFVDVRKDQYYSEEDSRRRENGKEGQEFYDGRQGRRDRNGPKQDFFELFA